MVNKAGSSVGDRSLGLAMRTAAIRHGRRWAVRSVSLRLPPFALIAVGFSSTSTAILVLVPACWVVGWVCGVVLPLNCQ